MLAPHNSFYLNLTESSQTDYRDSQNNTYNIYISDFETNGFGDMILAKTDCTVTFSSSTTITYILKDKDNNTLENNNGDFEIELIKLF